MLLCGIYRATRAARTAPTTPATGPVASLPASVVEAGTPDVLEPLSPPPPTKAVEVRVTTEREPERVLLETPAGLVGMVAPPEAGEVEGALDVSEAVVPAEVVSAALVDAGAVVLASVEAGAEELDDAAEEDEDEPPAASFLQASAAAAWALARSLGLHLVMRQGPTMPMSLAWTSGLQAQAVSVRAQPALGMASSRQGIWAC